MSSSHDCIGDGCPLCTLDLRPAPEPLCSSYTVVPSLAGSAVRLTAVCVCGWRSKPYSTAGLAGAAWDRHRHRDGAAFRAPLRSLDEVVPFTEADFDRVAASLDRFAALRVGRDGSPLSFDGCVCDPATPGVECFDVVCMYQRALDERAAYRTRRRTR